MRTAVALTLAALGLVAVPRMAAAQHYRYRPARYYHPGYATAPPPYTRLDRSFVQLERRYSLGLRYTVSGVNQTVVGDDMVLNGGGVVFRYRFSPHWGIEAGIDHMVGEFAGGRFFRSSVMPTVSATLHLVPRGWFDVFLIAGLGWVGSVVELERPPGRADAGTVEQSFGELQGHFGVGAEIRLGRAFGIISDLRYIGRTLDDSSDDGRWYDGVDDGVVPSTSQGAQFTLGFLFHF